MIRKQNNKAIESTKLQKLSIPFVKMHGAGNDYVYLDCFEPETAALIARIDLSELARRISDRHRGVGSDGLVLMMPSREADARMRIFNADGSEAEMCGNASRCVAKYMYKHGLCGQTMTLETLAGVRSLTLQLTDGEVEAVTVNMGTTLGNPHHVCITDEPVDTIAIHEIKGTNAEWINVLNRHEIRMRVWERGSGETQACGTGACASAVEAMNQGLTDDEVIVHMRGGDLTIRRDEQGSIFMTGPATEVFRGIYYWEE